MACCAVQFCSRAHEAHALSHKPETADARGQVTKVLESVAPGTVALTAFWQTCPKLWSALPRPVTMQAATLQPGEERQLSHPEPRGHSFL